MSVKELFGSGEEAWSFVPSTVITEESGNLGVLEFGKDFGFLVKRVFFLSGIRSDAVRGLHSHKELKQAIVCLSGAFTIELDNGVDTKAIEMRAGGDTLLLDGKVWRTMRDFSEDAVVMVLCDREYRFDEVVRDYSVFQEIVEPVNVGIQ
ncbi:sugar 3,4-ketoisomerase [Teredinibacter haidensis]|uniref:sugar 3,4-ketoisomerase n=1 Tax=Teredinibacter haidensis TaxID=2731755 RepID=UPI0009F9949E|nr:FdtA/QdtA family cupin domain-containing protein [Teredinibacter haidensis]